MTYCVAIKIKEGLIFASDSRTNAGIDNISVFCKTSRFEIAGERQIFLLNAGNLGTTQEVVSLLRKEVERGAEHNILQLDSLFYVARKVGDTVREVIRRLPSSSSGIDFGCSFLVGGQIKGEGQRLFMVYAAGNFIEATKETPFFQIGELKYGKPILDRVINYDTPLGDAIKCALVSFDSTLRSNLSVGLPINLSHLPPQTINHEDGEIEIAKPMTTLIDESNELFQQLRQGWCDGLQYVFKTIPNLNWWKI
jgi:putative proteasome-type protease